MAWIESHQELGRHPKTKRLARLLGINVPQALGHLHLLWWWALDYAQDGNLAPYDHLELADAALWEGEAATFVQALTSAGFLDVDLDGVGDLLIHDWEEYAGKLIAQRQANAEKMRAYRNRHKPQAPPPDKGSGRDMLPSHIPNVTVTSPSRNGATVQNTTVQNSTEPDSTVTGNAHTREQAAEHISEDRAYRDKQAINAFNAIPAAAGSIHARNEAAEQFTAFWQAYPRRRGVQTVPEEIAFNAFVAAVPRADWEQVHTGTANYAASEEVARGIVKNADNFLINHLYRLWQAPETAPEQKGPRNGYEARTDRNDRNLRALAARWQGSPDRDADHEEPTRLPA